MADPSNDHHHHSILKTAINEGHKSRLLSRLDLITDTIGRAGRHLQVNLVVLPSAYASDFRHLCARNPVPCPILGWTKPGDPSRVYPNGCIQTPDFDVRTDFPRYRVRVNGSLVAVKKNILDEWTDDHVAFLIGCSLSFEGALREAGHRICHEEDGKRPAMYKTNIPVLPAGVFCGGTVVVSMRMYHVEEVEQVRMITRPYLATHGEPIAWGWDGAEAIGIGSVYEPDFGDRQTFKGDEIPVFWGCGVTPQTVVEAVGDGIKGTVMTHDPGFVMITDWTVDDLPKLSACLMMENL
ncbi:hypothetical protein BHE90_016698 [Fusarium euwallaceae]|nr:hypothetical protein BHE90_016698 [Fusarium euwallaceae]